MYKNQRYLNFNIRYLYDILINNFSIISAILLMLILPLFSIYLGLFSLVTYVLKNLLFELIIINALSLLFLMFFRLKWKLKDNIYLFAFIGFILFFLFLNILLIFILLNFYLNLAFVINSFYVYIITSVIVSNIFFIFTDFEKFTNFHELVLNLNKFLLNNIIILVIIGLSGFIMTVIAGDFLFALSIFLSFTFTIVIKVLTVNLILIRD